MTDQQIIGHLLNNKYALALKGLYNILPSVKNYIQNNNGDADDAEDVFQDALVVLYKNVHADNFSLTVPLQYYLMAVVKNCWMAELRKRKKLPVTTVPDNIIASSTTEEDRFALATSAFNLLGEKCKQLLILFYFKKKSFKDIATALAFSDEKIAKNQKYRCMQKAKENFINLSNQTD